jgi:hypothetical protein
LHFLQQIPDPRGRQGQRHSLPAMLATVVCAVLSGCRGYRAIAQWIRLQDVPLWHALGYFRTPPTRNCFRKLLLAIDPAQLEAALWNWVTQGLGLKLPQEDLTAVTLDGKTLCGAVAEHERAVQVLSLLDQATGSVLRQTPVDPGTNEAKAAVDLLKSLVLKGKVVVADAMFCQRDVCQQILDSGGDYLVTLKDNQPAVKREVEIAFAEPRGFSPLRPETAA